MNLKNTNLAREISFFEIFLNFWKFKLFFLYIFLSVLFLNLLLINLIPKKFYDMTTLFKKIISKKIKLIKKVADLRRETLKALN